MNNWPWWNPWFRRFPCCVPVRCCCCWYYPPFFF